MLSTADPGRSGTRRAIVKLLKADGGMRADQLSDRLGLTAMAVRQHLYSLQREKLVTAEPRPAPVGRPVKYWKLTRAADRLFPDAYAELSVALIGAMGEAFGAAGLQRVLESRCARQQADYAQRIPPSLSLREKLQRLARIRTEEGYMAELKPAAKGTFLLVENHCPICAAASACQGFCATELGLFQAVLGPEVAIERAEHIVSGDRRCAYRITPKGGHQPAYSTTNWPFMRL
ncbi:MAG TPA: metalloregulator ArsR/SmtB family transcription factor [Bryobacteraceae bacterium]|nr:metalloregulator ArsR/SmtB family transcription factor [Bryobacteraceae bacterium]